MHGSITAILRSGDAIQDRDIVLAWRAFGFDSLSTLDARLQWLMCDRTALSVDMTWACSIASSLRLK
jgi:hypothetical protein